MTEAVKRVYRFRQGRTGQQRYRGQHQYEGPAWAARVPTLPRWQTSACRCLRDSPSRARPAWSTANAGNAWPEGALETIHEYREDLEQRIGKKIGDAEDPLLVSVRSGAPMSMPGMMDTVLNLGLNDAVHQRPDQADREPAFRLGLVSPFHPDVLQRRHGS